MRMAELELLCATGVAASEVGPELGTAAMDASVAGVAKGPQIGSPDAVALGTANGPTEEDALMLRAGLVGRALAKAVTMDGCRGNDGAIGVIGVAFGVDCCDIWAVFKVERRILC
jgi:hypothetical protein